MRQVLAIGLALGLAPGASAADAFEGYTNPILAKVPGAEGVQELKQLTPSLLADHDRVLAGTSAAFLVVKTNDGRWSKLLVQSARQKLDDKRSLPILLIERFVTYKEGEERAVVASSKNVYLFANFRLN